jgi:hypothetical protein
MKLNALLKTLGFLALAATPVVAGTAPAPKNPIAPAPENDDLGINASIGYDTNYIWRGVNYGQHWARAAVDGSLLLLGGASEDGAGTTSLVWGAEFGTLLGDNDSFSGQSFLGGNDTKQSFQRLMASVGVSHDFGPVLATFAYSYINNMGALASGSLYNNVGGSPGGFGQNDIHQLSLTLETKLGPIDIAQSSNIDLANGGWYFDLNASSTIAVTDSISVVPSVNIGYGQNYSYGIRQNTANALIGGVGALASGERQGVSGFTAITPMISIPVKLNSRATLTPYIAYNMPMRALRDFGIGAGSAGFVGPFNNYSSSFANATLFGGVTLTVSF